MRCRWSVSYTHLDVYKRQHVFIPPTPGPIAAASPLGIGDNLLLDMGMGALCSILSLIHL